MSNRTLGLDEKLYAYVLGASLREDPLLAELRRETAEHPMARMQIAPEQGQFMQLLLRMLGARSYIDVGVFTGYSALAAALVLPEDGRVVACDVSEEYTRVARDYWRRAGVEHKVDLRLRPALETLDALIDAGESGTHDFAFIDADKENYAAYYERCLTLLRPGGVIAVDNCLWNGSVADESVQDEETRAIRALNETLRDDARVDVSLVPIGDGLYLARKREG